MRVNNSGDSAFTIRRGEYTLRIPVGESTIPEYGWVDALVKKNPNLSAIVEAITVKEIETKAKTKKKVKKSTKDD